MPTYLVDSSALCKRYFVNEIGAAFVDHIFNDSGSTRYILNIAIVEVLNAFYRVHREGHLTETERDDLIAAFYDDIAKGILLVHSIRDEHIFQAEPIVRVLQKMKVSKKRPGPVDTLVIACARDFDLLDLILVSSDIDQIMLARQLGINTLDPETLHGPL